MGEYGYFPMFVDLSEKRVLVIGGGVIAARRIRTLLKFVKRITVIAPEINEELREIIEKDEESRICYIRQRIFEEMLFWEEENPIKGMEIVLTATNDRKLNAAVVKACRKEKILVNTADDKSLCDFYFPSVLEQDGVTIGLNSGGKNPGCVKRMREYLEKIK